MLAVEQFFKVSSTSCRNLFVKISTREFYHHKGCIPVTRIYTRIPIQARKSLNPSICHFINKISYLWNWETHTISFKALLRYFTYFILVIVWKLTLKSVTGTASGLILVGHTCTFIHTLLSVLVHNYETLSKSTYRHKHPSCQSMLSPG